MQRECLRHYWLICTTKTLNRVQEFSHEILRVTEQELLNILQILRTVDYKLKLASILKEFPFYHFEPTLYPNNRCQLIESINNFNEMSNQVNLLETFKHLSNSSFFNKNQTNLLQNLFTDADQLDMVNDFLFIFQHNLNLINMDEKHLDTLTKQIEKIEHVLIQIPRSYLYDITFNFSIVVEKIKINHFITPDKSDVLDIIYQSKSRNYLLNFHSSTPYEKKNFIYTIEQQIDAFNTFYDPILVEEIFNKLENCQDINSWCENKKLIEFIRWTTDNLERFEHNTIENILQKITISDLCNALQFLKDNF
ncbi:unnamed protein product [Didymodactylos carnosus]|uniref:Uncharacterized protein n=1 Tax=Didymodactylos carnosus TaxID=1234261 RepID=A0A8S2FCG3_9BILA|nr:unnamed protein product [Didymodactylos carnosus]CAF4223403.1 unnamed protein product [Didymodactylos carnosus]